jgi:hypothetical protein
MSIFGKIKDAIFGSPKREQAGSASSPAPSSSAASAAPRTQDIADRARTRSGLGRVVTTSVRLR